VARSLSESAFTRVPVYVREPGGPAWNAVPFDSQEVMQTPVGTASLVFGDGNTGAFSYNVNGIAQTKIITREVLRMPGTVCPYALASGTVRHHDWITSPRSCVPAPARKR
jgi:hypothetical protein